MELRRCKQGVLERCWEKGCHVVAPALFDSSALGAMSVASREGYSSSISEALWPSASIPTIMPTSDTHPADARLAAHNCWVDRDPVSSHRNCAASLGRCAAFPIIGQQAERPASGYTVS